MQVLGAKFNYFMRFGEKNNSVVFDITDEEKVALQKETLTFDELYEDLKKDPVKYHKRIEEGNINSLLAISGQLENNTRRSCGAGKSSILEAFVFILYGRIIRKTANKHDKKGLAGVSDIATRIPTGTYPDIEYVYPKGFKETWAEMILEDDGEIYRAKRGYKVTKKTTKPILELECLTKKSSDDDVNDLQSHIKKSTQEALNNIVKCDYDVYVNSQMFGQNDSGKFLTGTDKIKKEMVIQVLRVEDLLDGKIEAIRKDKTALEKKLDLDRRSLEDKIERQKSAKTPEELDVAIANNKKEIKTLQKNIEKLNKEITRLENTDSVKAVKSLDEKIKAIEKEVEPKQKALDEKLADLKKQHSEKKSLVEKISSQIDLKKKEISTTRDKITSFEKTVADFDEDMYKEFLSKLEKAKAVKPKYEKEQKELREHQKELLGKIGEIKGEAKRLKDAFTELSDQLEDGVDEFMCSSCKQNVTREHIENEKTIIKNALKIQKDVFKKLSDEEKEVAKELGVKEDRLTQINDKFLNQEGKKRSEQENVLRLSLEIVELKKIEPKLNEEIKELTSEAEYFSKQMEMYIDEGKAAKANVEKDLARYKDEIKDLNKQKEEYESKNKSINDSVRNIRLEISGADSDIQTLSSNNGRYEKDKELWKQTNEEIDSLNKRLEEGAKALRRLIILESAFGLNGIQTKLVQKYLPLLNMYIKETLDILSKGQIEMKLVINDKSQIDMIVIGGTAPNYQMLSGGEQRVIKLAMDPALGLLSFSRVSKKPEMINLDEIFANLDPELTDAAFDLVNMLASKFARVLVISHNPHIKDNIADHILVVKGSGVGGLSKIKYLNNAVTSV